MGSTLTSTTSLPDPKDTTPSTTTTTHNIHQESLTQNPSSTALQVTSPQNHAQVSPRGEKPVESNVLTTQELLPNSPSEKSPSKDTLSSLSSSSIRTLSKPLATYEQAISHLYKSFNETLALYQEIKDQLSPDEALKASLTQGLTEPQNEAVQVASKFQHLFNSIHSQIQHTTSTPMSSSSPRLPSSTHHASSIMTTTDNSSIFGLTSTHLDLTITQNIEKYSDLLMGRILQKLENVDVQKVLSSKSTPPH